MGKDGGNTIYLDVEPNFTIGHVKEMIQRSGKRACPKCGGRGTTSGALYGRNTCDRCHGDGVVPKYGREGAAADYLPQQQHLIFAGRQLDDRYTLLSYGITGGKRINLV